MNPKHHSQQDVYKDEGYKFMGAAFEVYNDRGYGLAEEIYQECLEEWKRFILSEFLG